MSWSNPATLRRNPRYAANTVFAWVPGMGPDLITGLYPTFTNSGKYGTAFGRRALMSVTNGLSPNGAAFGSGLDVDLAATGHNATYLLALHYVTSNAGGSPNLMQVGSGGDGIGSNGSAPNFKVFYAVSGATFTGARDLPAFKPTVIVVRHEPFGTVSMWIDGVKESFSDATGHTMTGKVNNFAGIPGGSSSGSGIYLAWAWNRSLTDGHIAELIDDPFRLLAPQTQKRYRTGLAPPPGLSIPLTALTISPKVPVINGSANQGIAPPLVVLTLVEPVPAINTTLSVNIAVPEDSILLIAYEPVIVGAAQISPSVVLLSLTAQVPIVTASTGPPVVVIPPVAVLVLGLPTPFVQGDPVVIVAGSSFGGGGGGSGGTRHGGGGKSPINLDDLDTFQRLDKKIAKGKTLKEALDDIDTPEEEEVSPATAKSFRTKRGALITEISPDEIEILFDEYYQ